METPEERKRRLEAENKQIKEALNEIKGIQNQLNAAGGVPAGGGGGRKLSGYTGAPYGRTVDQLANNYNKEAQNYADKGDYEEAIHLLNMGLKEVTGTPYENMFNEKIRHWKYINAVKKKTEDVWNKPETEMDRDKFRKQIAATPAQDLRMTIPSEAIEHLKEKIAEKFKFQFAEMRENERETAINKEVDKTLKEHFSESARKHLEDLDRTRGVRLGLSKIDDIQKAITEATRLGDLGRERSDVNFISRAIDLLIQAREDCEEDKDLYRDQLKQIKDLINKLEREKEAFLSLHDLVKVSGTSSPFLKNKIKIFQDDTEIRRDVYDSIAAAINVFRRVLERYKTNRDPTKEQAYKDAASKTANDLRKTLQISEDKLSKLVPEEDDEEILNAARSLVVESDIEVIKDNLEIRHINDTLKLTTNGAENARRRGEVAKDYATRAETKANDARDAYARRPLSSHKQWGKTEGNWAASDAAEWIGFSRDPIETFGNLSATIMTVYLVVWQIVGPILVTFSFFIPFLSVLKWPIFLVAIIILHPFMKAILHPIMKDVGFIAKDPYWYEEGTSVDKIRNKAYGAGAAINGAVGVANEELRNGPTPRADLRAAGVGAVVGGAIMASPETAREMYENSRRNAADMKAYSRSAIGRISRPFKAAGGRIVSGIRTRMPKKKPKQTNEGQSK